MWKFLAGAIIGLAVGALGFYFVFVGPPAAAQPPGLPIQRPDGATPAAAQIVLKQELFNDVLLAIFRDMSDPTFPLGQSAEGCESKLTLLPDGSGSQTAVVFENGKIAAPLVFNGSYSSALGCFQFRGWAKGNLDLRYDAAAQAVYGQINIETVNLDGVNPLLAGLITPIVQSTLNSRVNPVQIVDGRQLVTQVPIASAGGTLRAEVKDIRAEITGDSLNLYVTYNFSGL